MALISDPTLDGFNSYVSVEQADEYYSGTYFSDPEMDWATFTEDKKERLLITATRKISSLSWGGTPVSPDQVLPFPRDIQSGGEYGYSYFPNVSPVPIDGWVPVDDETAPVPPEEYIPTWLGAATLEWAMWIWTEDNRPATDVEFGMLKSQKIGPLDYVYRDVSGNGVFVPPSVSAILGTLPTGTVDTGASKPRNRRIYL